MTQCRHVYVKNQNASKPLARCEHPEGHELDRNYEVYIDRYEVPQVGCHATLNGQFGWANDSWNDHVLPDPFPLPTRGRGRSYAAVAVFG